MMRRMRAMGVPGSGGARAELRRRRSRLGSELSRLPAAGSVDEGARAPLHGFAEFYGVMRQGGFDVVCGGPA
jgi:hypothetical protein